MGRRREEEGGGRRRKKDWELRMGFGITRAWVFSMCGMNHRTVMDSTPALSFDFVLISSYHSMICLAQITFCHVLILTLRVIIKLPPFNIRKKENRRFSLFTLSLIVRCLLLAIKKREQAPSKKGDKEKRSLVCCQKRHQRHQCHRHRSRFSQLPLPILYLGRKCTL